MITNLCFTPPHTPFQVVITLTGGSAHFSVNGYSVITDLQLSSFLGAYAMRFENFGNNGRYKIDYKKQPRDLNTMNAWKTVRSRVYLRDLFFEDISIRHRRIEGASYAVTVNFDVGGRVVFAWGYLDGQYSCYVMEEEKILMSSNVEYTQDDVMVRITPSLHSCYLV